MTWLLGIRALLSKAFGWIVRYPWVAVCIALLLACAWLYHSRNGYKADLAAEKQSHADDIKSWQAKVREVEAARDRAATQAREASSNAQEYHEQLSQANSGLEQYIRDHRVQDKQCPGAVAGAGAGRDTAVPPVSPAVPELAVPEGDIRACDGAWIYAQSAYEWAEGLKAKGLAVVGE